MGTLYDRAMVRLIHMAAVAALAAASGAHAEAPVTAFNSGKPQSEVVTCLAAEIRKFDSPNVGPGEAGSISITTRIMQVTRINIVVTDGKPTQVLVRNSVKGKLKGIVAGGL